jgi:CCR4-NOT transcriptional regulation complex NOT5 subunit
MPLGIVIWVQCKFVDSWQVLNYQEIANSQELHSLFFLFYFILMHGEFWPVGQKLFKSNCRRKKRKKVVSWVSLLPNFNKLN